MGFLKSIFNNTKKPVGFMGKMMVKNMNSGHEKMASWGSSKLPEISPKAIVELGCGGGKNAEALMQRYPSAKMTAVDYSDISVEMARKRNEKEIKNGRCTVIQGDVSSLKLDNSSFDLATAFETIYFWPGPKKSFDEVYRVLKPGGYFLIVNECTGAKPMDQKWVSIIDGMTIYKEDELKKHLEESGFTDIKVFNNEKTSWAAFLALKK